MENNTHLSGFPPTQMPTAWVASTLSVSWGLEAISSNSVLVEAQWMWVTEMGKAGWDAPVHLYGTCGHQLEELGQKVAPWEVAIIQPLLSARKKYVTMIQIGRKTQNSFSVTFKHFLKHPQAVVWCGLSTFCLPHLLPESLFNFLSLASPTATWRSEPDLTVLRFQVPLWFCHLLPFSPSHGPWSRHIF